MTNCIELTVRVPVNPLTGKIKMSYAGIHYLLDKELIPEALKATKDNKSQAARMLDMSRGTFGEKCGYLGIAEIKSRCHTIKAKVDAVR